MERVAFKTSGDMPLEAFSNFGINAKVTDNPLGRFGTGLKYALAVILRLGGKFEVWVGGTQHVFYVKSGKFRGKDFDFVRMKKARGLLSKAGWSYTKLPFTTELGKDWVLWQAFREIESNTRDENGETFLIPDDYVVEDTGTTIIITIDGLAEILQGSEPVFLENLIMSSQPIWSSDFLDIYDVKSNVLFFRGIRVYDTKHPCRFTYNFKDGVTLTEDRTIKNIWSVEYDLAHIIRNKITDRGLLEKMLMMGHDAYETHDLALHTNDSYSEGGAFRSVVLSLHASRNLGRGGDIFYNTYLAPRTPALQRTITLHRDEWKKIEQVLRDAGEEELADKVDVG